MSTTAYATQKRWIGVDCDSCSTHYSCLVEATGTASDTFLPFSDDSLKEMAVMNLDGALQKKAEAFPCPACGAFQENHVERVMTTVKRIINWTGFVVVFLVVALLLAKIAPKAPAWILLVIIAVSLIVPRLFSRSLAARFHPNLDLAKNLQLARRKISGGKLRLQSPDGKLQGQG